MRLIDADALDSVVLRLNIKENAQITRGEYKLIDSVIFEFPTVDAVPVKHGRWIKDRLVSTNGGTYGVRRCSVCEWYFEDLPYEFKHCPHCGARMDAA